MSAHNLKIGAIICIKKIPGSNDREYEALLFITNIPHHVTDEMLTGFAGMKMEELKSVNECEEIIVRADINATSNEIWEQFKGLNNDADKKNVISFDMLKAGAV